MYNNPLRARILYKRVREKGTTEKKRKETIETFQHFTRRTAVFVLALFCLLLLLFFSEILYYIWANV